MSGKTLFAKEIILNRTGVAEIPSSNGLTTDGLSNLYLNGTLVGSGGGGAETLGELTDVEVSTASNGQVLMYISTNSAMTGTVSSNVLSSLALASFTIVDPVSGNNDGSITVSPTGGVGPYMYLWDDAGSTLTPTALNLIPGTYQCIIMDTTGDTLTVDFALAEAIDPTWENKPIGDIETQSLQAVTEFGSTTTNSCTFSNASGITIPNAKISTDDVGISIGYNTVAPSIGSVSIGSGAGSSGQGPQSVAIGSQTADTDQGVEAVAIGGQAGQSGQGDTAVAIGRGAGNNGQGDEAVAIGNYAGRDNQGDDAVSIGFQAGKTSQSEDAVAIGNLAGRSGQGVGAVAISSEAGKISQSEDAVAIGNLAGRTGQGIGAVAVGKEAGSNVQSSDAVAIGNLAGKTSQGIAAVAIGKLAGQLNQNTNTVAIGIFAGHSGQGDSSVAVGSGAGGSNQGESSVAIGSGAGGSLQGESSVAVGNMAGQTGQNTLSVAVGHEAGSNVQSSNAVAIGSGAGMDRQEESAIAIGNLAGETSQGIAAVAIGRFAGKNSQGIGAVSIGVAAGRDGQSSNAVAIGIGAGNDRQSSNAVAIGNLAGNDKQNTNAVAIGHEAGSNVQSSHAVAIGHEAGKDRQNVNAVAIGVAAGNDRQSSNAVAIGNLAGKDKQNVNTVAIGVAAGKDSQNAFSIAIGFAAGNDKQSSNAVAIGYQAGSDDQDINTVAIGREAGMNKQGASAVAIGREAGNDKQSSNAVAIGYQAGSNVQQAECIAIGASAGKDRQGGTAIAIGGDAGSNQQQTNAVAIGKNAGRVNQGANSIAIGYRAGYNTDLTGAQHSNTIILNATGSPLNSSTTDSFYVKPIRDVDNTRTLKYNETTGEITHSNVIGTVMSSNLIPSTSNVYDIGSSSNLVRSIFLGTSSLWMGDHHLHVSNGKFVSTKRDTTKLPKKIIDAGETHTADSVLEHAGKVGGNITDLTNADILAYAKTHSISDDIHDLYDDNDDFRPEHESSNAVHVTGDQTIGGVKIFEDTLTAGGDTNISGTLTAEGDTNISGHLRIRGAANPTTPIHPDSLSLAAYSLEWIPANVTAPGIKNSLEEAKAIVSSDLLQPIPRMDDSGDPAPHKLTFTNDEWSILARDGQIPSTTTDQADTVSVSQWMHHSRTTNTKGAFGAVKHIWNYDFESVQLIDRVNFYHIYQVKNTVLRIKVILTRSDGSEVDMVVSYTDAEHNGTPASEGFGREQVVDSNEYNVSTDSSSVGNTSEGVDGRDFDPLEFRVLGSAGGVIATSVKIEVDTTCKGLIGDNRGVEVGDVIVFGYPYSSLMVEGSAYFNSGIMMMPNLPTSDPDQVGQLWNDAGVLKISQ